MWMDRLGSSFWLLVIGLFVATLSQTQCKIMYIEVKYPLLGNESAPGSPWPMPRVMNSTSESLLYLNRKSFSIDTNMAVECDIIVENLKLYKSVLFPPRIYDESLIGAYDPLLKRVQINVRDNNLCPGYPNDQMDESYDILIKGEEASLNANTVWGAIRALETFSQLTFFTDDNKLAINDSTLIEDSPRFSYRGLLIDTARHYIPVPVLRKQLDAMAYSKLNVLHWHIVDDQSFPLELVKYKNISENGRYTKAHVYTPQDVKLIIEHGRLRGIRVIPEFDSPGHVASFGKTYPEFLTVCWHDGKPYQPIYGIQGKAEIFNPTVEEMYPVIKNVLAEFNDLFVDDYLHLGNDEVYYDCWKSNPNISEWMKRMNFSEYSHLQAYYTSKLLKISHELKKKSIVWEDVYENGVLLDSDTIIQVWKDKREGKDWSETLEQITRDGYKAILASPWYINYISYGYQEWFEWYKIEPLANFTGSERQAKLLIGGEVALWGEYVDGSNIDSRLWPRASVIAERLWSSASVNDAEDAKFRLDEHRCRLNRRGIPAAPVLNGYCGDYEYGMNKSVIFESVFNYGWPN